MTPAEQKAAAKAFVARWQAAEGNEDREARSYWIELLQDVLGIPNATRVLDFERRVKGRKIDAFYEDMGVLVESKSRKPGILDEARDNGKYGFETPYRQAKWYHDNMPHSAAPRWILLMDFDHIRIHDLDNEDPENDYIEIALEELPEQYHLLGMFSDHRASKLVKEKELSIQAAEIVGRLYDAFSGQYLNLDTDAHEQRSLNVLIVRLVFLLFAEDAGLLHERQAFCNYMKRFNSAQSRQALIDLFKVLDTPRNERDPYADPELLKFPYVNGSLFADEDITIPQFTEQVRVDLLLNAAQEFNWAGISASIFGAAFESTLNPETRRSGGMHYTAPENLARLLNPLMLDDLRQELVDIEGIDVEKKRRIALRRFQDKLASIKVVDMSCGSGNFLTWCYTELRKLENRVIESLQGDQISIGWSNDAANPIKVSINQFYGIEVNDFAVSVAKTALWIAESQMMEATQEIVYACDFDFLPLTTNTNIHCADALEMDWNEVLPASECSYIVGNPPWIGARMQTKEAKAQVVKVFDGAKNAGNVDLAAAWYMKAAKYIQGTNIRCALVSTNSLNQGEQVANVWKPIFDLGIHFDFAHDTFRWTNEASDQAHVFCSIIGFSQAPNPKPVTLYHHETPDSIEVERIVSRLNPYLLDAPDVFVWNRSTPLCDVPRIGIGNKPIDGGNYLFESHEKDAFIAAEPGAAKFFKRWMGSVEFIRGKERWVLWLGDATEEELMGLPLCRERVEAVRDFRLASKSAPTRKIADKPRRFHVENMPSGHSVVIPEVSSERREYVPMGFVGPEVMCSNLVRLIPNATLYHFGVLTSRAHNAWMRTVCGRMKSDYRYSGGIVYNNFPWPDPSDAQKAAVERCAQLVLDERDKWPDKSLADLYDPDKMPEGLRSAHELLDAAVEAAYDVDFHGDEERIVAHLFGLYSDAAGSEE